MVRRCRRARRRSGPDAFSLVISSSSRLDRVMATRHPKRRSVIHVAAGPRLGYGHLMRARALAQQLGMHVSVSIRGGLAAARTARALGLRVLQPSTGIDGADVLVVDDPNPTHGRGWIARARRAGVPTVSIHDFARRHDADLIVCGSVGIDAPRGPKRIL